MITTTWPGWHFWYRWRKPSDIFTTHGCFHNNTYIEHNRNNTCPDLFTRHFIEQTWLDNKYIKIAMTDWGFIWKGPTGDIVHQYHSFGR